MSCRHRLLLLPFVAILVSIAAAGSAGLVSGAPAKEVVGAALVGLALSCIWKWRAHLLFGAALILTIIAAIIERLALQHGPVFASGSLRTPAAVTSPEAAGLLVGMSLLAAVVVGWLLFGRQQVWLAIIILASSFLLRSDVDSRFASWLPLLVGACLALVLLTNIQSRPDFGRGTGILAAAGIAIAICWQLPTPVPAWSHGFIDPLASMVGNRYGPSVSEALELAGEFRPSNRAVMSIHTGRPLARPYWRLAVFDHYDGQAWTPTSGTSRTVPAGASMMPAANVSRGRIVNATVTVYQPDAALVSPGVPLGFSVASRTSYAAGAPQPSSVTAVPPLATGMSYRVSGVVSPVGLTLGSATASESLFPYTQLPVEPHRVQALASRIVRSVFGPVAQADTLVHYLRDSGTFHYDTRSGSPPGQDAVDSFLFATHSGYCNQFASALAILAREIGLPSRVVTGYVGGDYRRGSYLVRQRDAHSWVEIYVPGSGWLTFDPTPGFTGPTESAHARSSGIVGRRAGLVPTTRPTGNPLHPVQPPGHPYRVPIAPPHVPVHAARRALPSWLFLVALILLAALAAAVALARRMPANLYAALARGQSRTGLRIRAEETPLEFVERFQGRGEYDDARLIVDLYIRERYAGVEPSPAERRASQEAWGRLRGSRLPAYSITARR